MNLRCLLCEKEMFSAGWLCASCFASIKNLQCLERVEREDYVIFVLFFYTEEIRWLIRRMKFHEERYLAAFFSELIDEFLRVNQLSVEAVSHIPMHPWKKWVRGFDQAEDLASQLARRKNIPHPRLLRRVRFTSSLYRLGKEQRSRQMKHAFQGIPGTCRTPIMLIDDILTTGSTLEGAASALREMGIDDFFFLVLAESWKRI